MKCMIEQAKLLANDGKAHAWFGHSVAVNADGTVAVIGAPFDTNQGSDSGSATVFVLLSHSGT